MAAHQPGEVTRILRTAEAGDLQAAAELLPLVYHEFRRLAHDYMARETPGQTLQSTTFVHEAYVRLVGRGDISWEWPDPHSILLAVTDRKDCLIRFQPYSQAKSIGLSHPPLQQGMYFSRGHIIVIGGAQATSGRHR